MKQKKLREDWWITDKKIFLRTRGKLREILFRDFFEEFKVRESAKHFPLQTLKIPYRKDFVNVRVVPSEVFAEKKK